MTYHCLSGISAVLAHAFLSCRTVSFSWSSTDRSFLSILWRFQINTLVCNVWQPEPAVIADRCDPAGSLCGSAAARESVSVAAIGGDADHAACK